MTDNQPPTDRPAYQPVTLPPRRGNGGRPLFWLLMLVLLSAVGYGGWCGWQWLGATFAAGSTQQDMVERLAGEVAALRRQTDELSAGVRRQGEQVTTLGGRLEGSEEAVTRLSDAVEGGRSGMQLAAVEQLLLMANDRLLLAHDAAGALKALDLADQRLARLNDPRLFKVREALAQDRAALATLALPDYTGLSLTLAELLKRAPQLRLRGRVPERFSVEPELKPPPPDAGALGRIWAAVKQALSNIFALRRSDAPPPRLLPPDEEALVAQILQLKLEGARLALLASDARTFRDLCATAADWLHRYYDETDPNVGAALAELRRIEALPPAPALPDISRSLALLRSGPGAAPR